MSGKSGTTFNKRQKERKRQEKQQEKAARKVQRTHEKKDRPAGEGEDPDIAGIVPGPQPPPDWLTE